MTGPRIYIQAGTSLYLLRVNANPCLWLVPASTSRLALLCLTGSECKPMLINITGHRIYIQAGTTLSYWEWMQTDAYDWPQNLHPGWHFFVLTGSECKPMLMTGPRIYIQAGTYLYLLGVNANRCLWLAPESTSRLALLCTYWEWMQTDAYDWPQNLHPGWHFYVLTGSECKPMLMTGPRIYIQAGTSLYLLAVKANRCLWLAPESTSRLALLCTYWVWMQTDAYDWPQNLHPGWHFFVLTGSECKPMLMTGPRIYIQAGTSLYLLGVNANRCLHSSQYSFLLYFNHCTRLKKELVYIINWCHTTITVSQCQWCEMLPQESVLCTALQQFCPHYKAQWFWKYNYKVIRGKENI